MGLVRSESSQEKGKKKGGKSDRGTKFTGEAATQGKGGGNEEKGGGKLAGKEKGLNTQNTSGRIRSREEGELKRGVQLGARGSNGEKEGSTTAQAAQCLPHQNRRFNNTEKESRTYHKGAGTNARGHFKERGEGKGIRSCTPLRLG